MKIMLLGIGLGSPQTLTQGGREALRQSDAVIGARRILDSLPEDAPATRFTAIAPAEIAALIGAHAAWKQVCVAYSGDVGFYSGARGLRALLEGSAHQIEAICGITTAQYLAARLGESWQDWQLISAHGADCDVLSHVLGHPRCFFLTGGAVTPATLCRDLCDAGLSEVQITVGQRLSYPEEALISGSARELCGREFDPLSAVLVRRDTPAFCRASRVGGIPDEEFLRGGVPMTKREVRSVILSLLAPGESDVLWDVGAGTGSVAVELALAARRGRVYAVERAPEGCELICQNRARFGVYNLLCIPGSAPDACAELPAPDAAFVGGTGGAVEEILRLLLRRNPRVRVVVSAVTLDTLARATAALRELGYSRVEVCQIAVSRTKALGGAQLLAAQNPVFLISGEGGHD